MMTWGDVGSRWAEEVGAALGFQRDTLVLGLSEELGYQGSCHFVAQPGLDEVVVYSWSYGSCQVCDGWESNEASIPGDVQGGAQRMTMAQFREYAKGVLTGPEPDYDGWPSNRKAVAAAVATLEGK